MQMIIIIGYRLGLKSSIKKLLSLNTISHRKVYLKEILTTITKKFDRAIHLGRKDND
jgi:hypothetical protein